MIYFDAQTSEIYSTEDVKVRSALKLMNSELKMMNVVLKMMNFALIQNDELNAAAY